MGGKEAHNLNGITLEGIPLGTAIERIEDVEKSSEAREVRQETINEHKRNAPRYTGSTSTEETRRVSKRTVHLPVEQIRKEYGIMSKPYATVVENVIWAVMEKGPLSVSEISGEIAYESSRGGLSALMTQLWRMLGTDHDYSARLLHRQAVQGHSRKYAYMRHPDSEGVTPEAAYIKFKALVVKRKKANQEAKKQRERAAATPDTPKKETPESKVETIEKTLGIVNALGKALGIKIEVSGNIDITFKLG